MIWLAWRQMRSATFVVGISLGLLMAGLLVSGAIIRSDFTRMGIGSCLADPTRAGCDPTVFAFQDRYLPLTTFLAWLNVFPALAGALVGAPLVARELEQRTHLLVWTQGITRTRWLFSRLGEIVCVSLLAALILTAAFSWWHGPLDQFQSRFNAGVFDLEGMVPLSYTLFAVALGIAAGAFIRRSVPAIAATLAGFLAVRLPILLWARPYGFQRPVVVTWDPFYAHTQRASNADWILSDGQWVDRHGQHVGIGTVFNTCASGPTDGGYSFYPGDPFTQCTHAHGWLIQTIYQPADRFWVFQGIESAIFIGLAIALLALTLWWVRRT